MQENLIGYLLCALEADECAEIQRRLAADTELRRKLLVLRRSLTPLEACRGPIEVPAGLAENTCKQIRRLEDQRAICGVS